MKNNIQKTKKLPDGSHMKIVRIDKNEYETEDGRVFEHLTPLDEVPSLEEFQKIHDLCHKHITDLLADEELD